MENDFFEMARGIAGDLVERMEMTDEFTNPKKQKTSKCYRITYRSMDRSLTDDEVNAMQIGSTRLNSSHITISYAVFCLKKKKK